MSDKNKNSWNNGAAAYSKFNHNEMFMNRILNDPSTAFHKITWEIIGKYVPDLCGKKICIPSSGDYHAVFAFAMLGAKVTSCDIAENQLQNAEKIARHYGWDKSIEFICADTMVLDGIMDNTFDCVYTSNGVHVWIDNLPGMYCNIHRILKPGGVYMMHEIHPFLRPFDDELKIKKPYDSIGPFETSDEITFTWRVMDIMNAITDSGLNIKHVEEMFAEKDINWPFWISYKDIVKGVKVTQDELNRMHDWKNNPMAALPNWICIAAQKSEKT